jgi:hypothetical protein
MSDNEEVHTLEEVKAELLKFRLSPAFGNAEIGRYGAHIWRKDGKITLRVASEGHAFNLTFPLDDERG